VSYNVLADAYTSGASRSHYPNTDMRVLTDFKYRATRVIRELSEGA